jgi:hypothetical protein
MGDWVKPISVAFLSVVASVGGILIAVFVTHHKDDALRGGALGTALALILMFVARNYGMKLYEEAKSLAELRNAEPKGKDDKPKTVTVEQFNQLTQRVESLRAAIVLDGAETRNLNWVLIGATMLAAVVCAFGDKIACYFGAR